MPAPLLSDLREPPVVGRFYMVPTVRYPWHNVVDDWPVIGPAHEDAKHLNFAHVHYHLDPRFLTARQAAHVKREGDAYRITGIVPTGDMLEYAVAAWPLFSRHEPPHRHRPDLSRRKCRAASYTHGARLHPNIVALGEAFAGAAAICRRDGRKLCPHRKVDLSQFPPDADGIVTCPLHGLRVRVAEVAA